MPPKRSTKKTQETVTETELSQSMQSQDQAESDMQESLNQISNEVFDAGIKGLYTV